MSNELEEEWLTPEECAAVPLPTRPIAAFPLDELGNATRMRYYYGHDLLYSVEANGWYIWSGRRWEYDKQRRVHTMMKRAVQMIHREAKLVAKGELVSPDDEADCLAAAEAARKFFSRSRNWRPIQSAVQLACDELAVLQEEFDTHAMLLNCMNGTIDLTTGELLPHDRKQRLTRLCPVEYHPGTVYPRWHQFLFDVFGNDHEMLEYIQRLVGYALTGDTRERGFFILYGSGRNGKGTFLNTLMKLFADYGAEIQAESLAAGKRQAGGASPDIAKLRGARLVSASESDEGRRLAEALVKRMTGGTDKLTGRFNYQDEVTFTPEFKLFLMTNHRPEIRGTDQGIWDRIHCIPFAVRFFDPAKGESGPDNLRINKSLPDELEKELPGILAWAVEGCLKWQQGGLQVPERVRAATATYRAEQDTLAGFIEECCTVQAHARATKGEMYQAYVSWSKENGMDAMTKPKFSRQMKEREFGDMKTNNAHYWTGIGLAAQGHMDYEN